MTSSARLHGNNRDFHNQSNCILSVPLSWRLVSLPSQKENRKTWRNKRRRREENSGGLQKKSPFIDTRQIVTAQTKALYLYNIISPVHSVILSVALCVSMNVVKQMNRLEHFK
jgi:hypothetical protein